MTTLDRRLTNDSILNKPARTTRTRNAINQRSFVKRARFHRHPDYAYTAGPFVFRSADAAPLTSPHTETEAADSLTVTDTGNKLSVAAKTNALTLASNTPNYGSGVYGTTVVARAVGVALLAKLKLTTFGLCVLGWGDTARTYVTDETDLRETIVSTGVSGTFSVSQNGADDGNAPGAFIGTLTTLVAGVEYDFAIVLRATGAFYLIKGGQFNGWRLLWVSNDDATASLYPLFSNNSGVGTLTDVRVIDVEGVTEFGWAAFYDAATEANQIADGVLADALIEHTITAATGITQTLDFRRVDANNYLQVEMDQGNSTIKLIEVVDNAPTTIATEDYTWTNSTDYRIIVRAEGQAVSVRVNGPELLGVTDSDECLTGHGLKVSRVGADLAVWPLTVNLPNAV